MTYLIYFSLIFVNLMFGIKRFFPPLDRIKASRSKILTTISFIGIFILIAGYRNYSGLSSDLINNEYEYINIANNYTSVYEPGYVLLMKAGSLFSLDFYSWRSSMTLIALLLVFISVYRWSSNPHFVISFFSGYLVIVSAEQFRHFLGFAIFTYGLVYYLYSGRKYKKIRFSLITIFAGMIHSLFYIYLLLILIDKSFSIKTIRRIVSLVLVFCVIVFLNGNNIPGLNFLLNMMGDSRVAIYLRQSTRFGFAYPMLLHSINAFLAYYAYNQSRNRNIHSGAYKANLLMMIFFPLYMIQTTFSRIARNLLVVTYITQGDFILEGKPSANRLGYVFLCLLGLGVWFYVSLFITTNPEAVFKPFFEDNFYLNNLFLLGT